MYDQPFLGVSPSSPVLPTPTSITPLINQDSVPEDELSDAGQRAVGYPVSPPPPYPAPPIPKQVLSDEELERLDMLPPQLPPVTIKSQRVPIYDNDHEVLEPLVRAAAERAFQLPTVHVLQDHHFAPRGDSTQRVVEEGIGSNPAQEQVLADESEETWYENVSSSTTGCSPIDEVSQLILMRFVLWLSESILDLMHWKG